MMTPDWEGNAPRVAYFNTWQEFRTVALGNVKLYMADGVDGLQEMERN